jgi:hypothetical protein
MHTKETFAALITGRQYRREINKPESELAKASRLLVIFGASDDLVEFEGLFTDEAGLPNAGQSIMFDEDGIIPDFSEFQDGDRTEGEYKKYFKRKESAKTIQPFWCKAGQDFTFYFETELPHATFEIFDGEEAYCRGIVIQL